MLADLQNSVATGVLLVAVIILFALGYRASLFIGIAIPASFLAGVLGLQLAGLTVNIVVLFSLILAVGMLVDDAIIVSEFAERRMAEGMPPKEAYALAAKRMAGPVIAATATRVAAFSPLLFWPGVVGQFMKYLPITLIATLSASLVGGAVLHAHAWRAARQGRAGPARRSRVRSRALYAHREARAAPPGHDARARCVRAGRRADGVRRSSASGVEFFPSVEPDYGQVVIHGRGTISLDEKDRFVRAVEERVLELQGASRPSMRAPASSRAAPTRSPRIRSASSSSSSWTGVSAAPRTSSWMTMREKTADIPGILVEVTAPRAGPPTGKPVQVQLSALDPDMLPAAAKKVAAILQARTDVRDVDDGQPLPGVDWKIDVNKAEAAKYGAGVSTVGIALQLVTNGVKITEYRPSDNDKAVDIIVRFPQDRRSLDQMDDLRVQTPIGQRADRQFRRA